MITNKLEVNVKLYKTQFDKFCQMIFGGYKLDRLSLDLDGMSFRIKYMIKHNKDLDKLDELKEEFSTKALELRNTFGEFMYEMLCQIVGIPEYAKLEDIIDILAKDVKIDTINVEFTMIVLSDNERYLQYLDERFDCGIFNMFPLEYFRYQTDSYNDAIAKAYPELFENRHQDKVGVGADGDVFCHNFTFQTTEKCSLNCTYCYQFNKSEMRMSFDTAKEFIDNLLADKYGYINRYNSPAIIIEFIGGEPLLEIELTRKIYEYFLDRCYELDHPWFHLHRVSICSNGLRYFDQEVQDFFKDYSSNISFNISIDGNKELHDACRIQPNGEGSYDICMAALNHFNKHYTSERNSKMTLAPSNMKYLFDSVVDFINHDMKIINLNCVFEEGWNQETAREEYYQLKKLADYVIDNDLENIYIAIFNERQEGPQLKENDGNFCFVEGTPILSEDGNKPIEEVKLGDQLYTSLGKTNTCIYIHKDVSDDNTIISTGATLPIISTSDHKFIVKRHIGKDRYDQKFADEEFIEAKDIKENDIIILPIINIPKKNKTWITNEIAYIFGVFIANGNIDISNEVIYFNVDYGFADVLDKYLNDAHLTFERKDPEIPKKARYHITYSLNTEYKLNMYASTHNVRFYKLCVSCGINEKTKHLPKLLFNTSLEILEKFYEGFENIVGGRIYNNWDEPIHGIVYPEIEYKREIPCINQYIMNDIAMILRCLGHYPHCEKVKKEYIIWYDVGYDGIDKDNLPTEWYAHVTHVKHDNKMRNVYCPTVSTPVKQQDVHTIIVNGMGAKNCGGLGSMLSLRPNGDFYPCIRYMPSSIGEGKTDYCIGNIKDGMIGREQGSEVLKMMDSITRRSQSNDICYDCPLSNDCAWCSALSATVYGTPNKRPMFICIQMIAEALANVYYWNILKIKHPEYNLPIRKNVVPDEWARLVISQDELDELTLLQAYVTSLEIEK